MKEEKKNPKNRRGALQVMGQLTLLVKPLLHIMALAVLLGAVGYLCAIFLTIFAGQALLLGLKEHGTVTTAHLGIFPDSVLVIFISMIVMAVLRGVLHYAEQYCNHFIAFKLLAIIRGKVFTVLRKLCPAKLEGRDKGNLISIITTDIELLEVFYAHTISPVAIAVITSLFMVLFMGSYHWLAGVLALAAYLVVGMCIPLWNTRQNGGKGMVFRNAFGELNSFVLDSLRGLDETVQYEQGANRMAQMKQHSQTLSDMQGILSGMEGAQRSVTTLSILLSSFAMLGLTLWLYSAEKLGIAGVITCTIAMMGSFGPVVALANLSGTLSQTLASGHRVLSLLEEEPLVVEVPGEAAAEDEKTFFTGAQAQNISFAYEAETILSGYSIKLPPGKITGIHGKSGSGKSTLLRLFMRFWDVQKGQVLVDGADVRRIPTKQLRQTQSFVTQETHLFHDTIAGNIAVAKRTAGREEIMEAAKKASIHDFIMKLPQGYDTMVGELGDTLSGGERQRIGIARAFLHDADFLLLDEPTSNLDALNEGIILKSLKAHSQDKTVVLVSHRKSTLNIAEEVCGIAHDEP